MAMILTGLTHDYSITPKTVINYLDSSGQWYAMHESDCSGCGGWMYKSAIDVLAKKYNFSHDELFNDYGCSSSKTGCSSSASKDSKIDAMTEALKMGHMLLIDVPNHFVTFISIDANNKIMVFNPATYAWVGSPDYVWSEFYDYNERCTKNGNCGIHSAFEIYPSSGMSLYEWRNIDK